MTTPAEMKRERPVLFSAPMVRAILAGTKTQTRRIIKPQPPAWGAFVNRAGTLSGKPINQRPALFQWVESDNPHPLRTLRRWPEEHHLWCPYAKNHTKRLWVRETFASHDGRQHAYYRADHPEWTTGPSGDVARWRPSIHMPRWASRIDLEITEVRVQRLQDISEEDARAEGVSGSMYSEHWTAYDPDTEGYPSWGVDPTGLPCNERLENIRHHPAKPMPGKLGTARGSFELLWDSIHGAGAWDANPWVWALTFRRVTP